MNLIEKMILENLPCSAYELCFERLGGVGLEVILDSVGSLLNKDLIKIDKGNVYERLD